MEGKIYITGDIGCFWDIQGVQLIDIIQQVKKQPDATSFDVFIDSEGGECEAGFDIYNYLRSLGVPIKTVGVGAVMSIATVIFMAGDSRVLRQGAEFMIHLPSGGYQGTADEIEEYAEQVRAVEKRLIDFYKKTIQISEEAIRPLLKNETYLTAEQATSLGFATEADVAVAAKSKLYLNLKSDSKMTKEDKSWIENLFGKVENVIKNIAKSTIVGLKLTDATGVILDFPDLADDAKPAKGDKVTVDGNPADGEYLMPDGVTYVCKEGLVDEVKEAAPDPDAEALAEAKAETARLEGELATEKAARTAAEKSFSDLATEVKNLKKAITSKGVTVEKKDPPKKDEPGERESRSLLKRAE